MAAIRVLLYDASNDVAGSPVYFLRFGKRVWAQDTHVDMVFGSPIPAERAQGYAPVGFRAH